jgi:hypothetical protein
MTAPQNEVLDASKYKRQSGAIPLEGQSLLNTQSQLTMKDVDSECFIKVAD